MRSLTIANCGQLPFAVEEEYSRLRINLGFCGDRFKKILITSSVENEGKSFTSIQLWRQMAESGKRVVFVDADMRKSVLRSRHGISTDGGKLNCLEHFLAGSVSLNDVVYSTNVPNGYFVPTENEVANPILILQSPRFAAMLDELAKAFDYVFIDSPPLTTVTDGGVIAASCDGALLVVRSAATSRQLISRSFTQLERAGCELLGVVISRAEVKKAGYYKKYGYGYGYGYGEKSKKKKSK